MPLFEDAKKIFFMLDDHGTFRHVVYCGQVELKMEK